MGNHPSRGPTQRLAADPKCPLPLGEGEGQSGGVVTETVTARQILFRKSTYYQNHPRLIRVNPWLKLPFGLVYFLSEIA
jgi:hypothetical protein